MPKNMGKGDSESRSLATAESLAEALSSTTLEEPTQRVTKKAGKEEALTVYASVTEMLGDDHVKLMCSDGRVRIGHVRGKMRRRHLVALNDTVLAWVWPFDQGQCDIDKKCVAEKVKELIAEGHLSEKSCAGGGDCPREEEERNRDPSDALIPRVTAMVSSAMLRVLRRGCGTSCKRTSLRRSTTRAPLDRPPIYYFLKRIYLSWVCCLEEGRLRASLRLPRRKGSNSLKLRRSE